MSITIHTKYTESINGKKAKINAHCLWDRKRSLTVRFNSDLDSEERHIMVVFQLLYSMSPRLANGKVYLCGTTVDNLGYVFSINPTIFEFNHVKVK